jgi:hypothetical protein
MSFAIAGFERQTAPFSSKVVRTDASVLAFGEK